MKESISRDSAVVGYSLVPCPTCGEAETMVMLSNSVVGACGVIWCIRGHVSEARYDDGGKVLDMRLLETSIATE